MSGRAVARAALRSLAITLAVVVGLLATPVAGVLAIAGWQEYAPDSLRVVIDEVSALTEAGAVDGVLENFIATLEGRPRDPG